MTAPLRLRRLLNADGEVVGWFSDHVAEMAARREWEGALSAETPHVGNSWPTCRSVEAPVAPNELEDVELSDGDRMDYNRNDFDTVTRVLQWLNRGATSIEVSRWLINKYRRPGMSNRDADLGGPVEAAGVLYVLRVKAPKA